MTEARRQRMILAGKYMLGEGVSLKKALIKAGYAENSARTPGKLGITAESCIQAAVESGEKAIPATIREDARKLLQRAIREVDVKRTPLSAIARTTEITEKWYGERTPLGSGTGEDPTKFVDKLEWVAQVMEEVRRRGLVGLKAIDDSFYSPPEDEAHRATDALETGLPAKPGSEGDS